MLSSIRKVFLLALHLSLTWFLFSGLHTPLLSTSSGTQRFEFSILEGSKISVLGSTNINEFACFSEEHYAKRNSELYFEAPKNTFYFKGTQLKVPVSTLDCGNIAMNSNLCTTLNAEKYPDIGIELIEVTSKDGQPLNITGLTTMIAKVKISMAGQTRLREIRFAGKQTSPGNYFFTGIHNILLSDYNIEAPEAFFGLIKVNDLIAVKFNLNVAAKMLDAD